jgi:hypothetical protein
MDRDLSLGVKVTIVQKRCRPTKIRATASRLFHNQPHQNTSKMSSSTTRPPASSSATAQPAEKSFFEQQREELLKEIGVVCN